jgi:hypothetical protein
MTQKRNKIKPVSLCSAFITFRDITRIISALNQYFVRMRYEQGFLHDKQREILLILSVNKDMK